jgi:CheY-like chemotaxis protein
VNKNGPIIIIEDDADDRLLIELTYEKLDYKNELVFLEDGEIAINYLMNMKRIPFLIISDINLPKINGIELRARVKENEAINIKCVPYVLFSTTATKDYIDDAYSLGIQGYFKKTSDPNEVALILENVIRYWKCSYAPGMYL